MSTKGLYSIYDLKTLAYSPPFMAHANGDAIRSFQELINDKQSMPSKYPADFYLVKLGEFDERTGVLLPESHLEPLVLGVDVAVKNQ